MRTLTRPQIDEEKLYKNLKKPRRKATVGILKNAESTVLEAYLRYAEGEISNLSTVIGDSVTAAKLRSNYEILRSGSLADEGAKILARSRTCCLCGLRATAELDHYLPKELFPEFSAYTLNLVPVCGTCNKQKGEDYRTPDGKPVFIHAYLDELPNNDAFLTATLSLDGVVLPSFRIVRTPGMTDEIFQVLTMQFSYFKLEKIYAEQAIELLDEKYEAIKEYFADGGAGTVEKYLHREAKSVARTHGQNHWKSALLVAVSNSVEFCNGGFKFLDMSG
ncbi:HNH endonuclease [Corynebacterium sp. A21]|uniref:HNH endonuclease n=1 Tax=Corynebacterium sp. A21 TaxID=3457318 RepID=UPI003FD3C808